MANSAAARVRQEPAKARDHLIVALDVRGFVEAWEIVNRLGDEVSFYKIGWHLFEKGLVDFVEELIDRRGKRIFLDFKSVDIGETMRGAVSRFSQLGVDFVTVMGTSGTISAAKEGRVGRKPQILVVTLLTDHTQDEMWREYNNEPKTVEQFVAERATMAAAAGADGVIASAREVAAIRQAVPKPGFLIVTPGIRPAGVSMDDQRRTATPASAITASADYLVIGRPIIKASDKLAAARGILSEMQAALDER